MTDREPMEAPFQTIDLAPTMDDAALLRATRATLRRGDGPVLFRGLLDRPLDDAESFAAWLATLDGSRSLLCLAASGKVGPRGLALALACDLAFAGPDVGASPEWRATLGLATLASRRLGRSARGSCSCAPTTRCAASAISASSSSIRRPRPP